MSDEQLGEACELLATEISELNVEILKILKSNNLTEFVNSNNYYLKELKNNLEETLEIYWSKVLYFSFNKTTV